MTQTFRPSSRGDEGKSRKKSRRERGTEGIKRKNIEHDEKPPANLKKWSKTVGDSPLTFKIGANGGGGAEKGEGGCKTGRGGDAKL